MGELSAPKAQGKNSSKTLLKTYDTQSTLSGQYWPSFSFNYDLPGSWRQKAILSFALFPNVLASLQLGQVSFLTRVAGHSYLPVCWPVVKFIDHRFIHKLSFDTVVSNTHEKICNIEYLSVK